MQEEGWSSRVPLHVLPPSLLLYTDASVTGWGTYLFDLTADDVLPREEKNLHISFLEMKVVILALNAYLDQVLGKSTVLMRDNATVVI